MSGAETTGTISPDNGGGSTISASTRVSHWNINDTEMVIEGRDYAYLVERQTARTWDGKPGLVLGSAIASMKHHSCRFVIGDNVSYAQSKNRLYLIDADGKECKFEITRQERVVH